MWRILEFKSRIFVVISWFYSFVFFMERTILMIDQFKLYFGKRSKQSATNKNDHHDNSIVRVEVFSSLHRCNESTLTCTMWIRLIKIPLFWCKNQERGRVSIDVIGRIASIIHSKICRIAKRNQEQPRTEILIDFDL